MMIISNLLYIKIYREVPNIYKILDRKDIYDTLKSINSQKYIDTLNLSDEIILWIQLYNLVDLLKFIEIYNINEICYAAFSDKRYLYNCDKSCYL
jgi:hypothetical protein